jgi:hypothetical protein
VGNWNYKFPDIDNEPTELEFKEYIRDVYRSEKHFWKSFIYGASEVNQIEVLIKWTPIQLGVLENALEDREHYLKNRPIKAIMLAGN